MELGLPYKLKQFLHVPYYLVIESYLENPTFVFRQFYSFLSYFHLQVGVPQSSDLAPELVNIFTAYMENSLNTMIVWI